MGTEAEGASHHRFAIQRLLADALAPSRKFSRVSFRSTDGLGEHSPCCFECQKPANEINCDH